MTDMILQVENVSRKFGGLQALDKVSLSVQRGEILALIGPNGAGKTTLFNCISGFIPVDQGQITYKGRKITNWAPHKVCSAGIARTFQVVQILGDMTVAENTMVGAFLRHLGTREARERAMAALRRVGLSEDSSRLAKYLGVPDKKRLEVAMALATEPEILMLDECMAGLNPVEFKEIQDLIRSLQREGVTLIVVEHVMEAIMPICDQVVVLNTGLKIAEGKPSEISKDREVIKAYLGVRYAGYQRS